MADDTLVNADVVAGRLRDPNTRLATLDALESHVAPIPTAASLAVAPALGDLLAMHVAEVERSVFDRTGLLLARLHIEALPDPAPVHGAAFGNERYQRCWEADSCMNTAILGKTELTFEDARSYACFAARQAPAGARGFTVAWAAAGLTDLEWYEIFMRYEPFMRQPSEDVKRQMIKLLLELLKSNELPELAIGGAWMGISWCLSACTAVASVALECGIFETAAAHLNAIGSPADWVVRSKHWAGEAASHIMRCCLNTGVNISVETSADVCTVRRASRVARNVGLGRC